MTATNRVQVTMVREVTAGVTPNTPRMRTARVTDERLTFAPQYIDSNELRADRMTADPIKVLQSASGSINFEMSYPDADSPLSDILRSAAFEVWTNTPTFFNDGSADSVITDAGTTSDTYTVASGGAAAVLGMLVRASGFTNSANNQVFRVASSTGTTIVGSSLSLTAETAPPGNAKLKVVGFAGVSGDITASSTGLASTTLDFTTLGLSVGRWLKIGGTAAGDKFATAALNDWVRITVIAAHALTLDNLPSGWTTDTGTSKTIKVWVGDYIKNGVTATSLSTEVGFLDQVTPTYVQNVGMQVNTLAMSITSRQVITGSANFTGLGGQQVTTSLDSAPDAATTGRVMAANSNVGRVAEGGSPLIAPNWARSLTFQVNNNLRTVDDFQLPNPVSVNPGECTVTGKIETYFGDNTLLAKLYTGTPTAISSRWQKDSQAIIWQFPRVTFTGGDPQVSGKNQDVTIPLDFKAAIDVATNAHFLCDRLPYYE